MSKERDDFDLEKDEEFDSGSVEDVNDLTEELEEDFDFDDDEESNDEEDFDFDDDKESNDEEESFDFDDDEKSNDEEDFDLDEESLDIEDSIDTDEEELSDEEFDKILNSDESLEDEDLEEDFDLDDDDASDDEIEGFEKIDLDSVKEEANSISKEDFENSLVDNEKRPEKSGGLGSGSLKTMVFGGLGVALFSIAGSVGLMKLTEGNYVQEDGLREIMEMFSQKDSELKNLAAKVDVTNEKVLNLENNDENLGNDLKKSSGVDEKMTSIISELHKSIKKLTSDNIALKEGLEIQEQRTNLVMKTSTKMLNKMKDINQERSAQFRDINNQISEINRSNMEMSEDLMIASKNSFELATLKEQVNKLQAERASLLQETQKIIDSARLNDTGLNVPVKVTISSNEGERYAFVGVVEETLFLRDENEHINSYKKGEVIPGYGKILSIKSSGEVQTDKGSLRYNL